MPATYEGHEPYDTLLRIIAHHTGRQVDELRPETPVRELAIDSITAAEIVSQAEEAVGATISLHRVLDDWSALTVDGLVRGLAEGVGGHGRDD